MNQLDRLKAAFAGSYDIDREVGAGGMATVYLARDLKHDRRVAIKVLRPELAAALGPDRFPREIRIVAQLQHPHVLPLHDSGESDGFLYYVMPFVDGESLRKKLDREGQLPVHDAVRILREVVDALAYAHGLGILHRDIKPDNVMLSGRHAMVMDFGVAKAVSAAGGETLTTVGVAVGTPQYMSPEQATGAENLDHRSDIYSIGILAYELLTGDTPFKGRTAQAILSAQVLEKAKPVSEIRQSVPAPLAELISRCLEKQPADRWQSAEEILRELEAIATPSGGITPTTTRPVKVTDAKLAPAKAGLPRAATVGVAAALVIAIAGYVGWRALVNRTAGADHVAVMPLQDLSGSDGVFADAMQDQIIVALGQVPGASVSPRSAVMQYRSEPKPMRDVAAELGVGAILEGTLFRAGDRMRINVQLVEPQSVRQLWSQSYELNVSDVLAAQDSVVKQIAAGIQGAVITPTGNPR